jgi:hypothetical protein
LCHPLFEFSENHHTTHHPHILHTFFAHPLEYETIFIAENNLLLIHMVLIHISPAEIQCQPAECHFLTIMVGLYSVVHLFFFTHLLIVWCAGFAYYITKSEIRDFFLGALWANSHM